MMKLRLSSGNSARAALNSLAAVAILALYLCGCTSSSSQSTYSAENLCPTLEKILKDEYQIKVVAKLVGQTLWIYLPLDERLLIYGKPRKQPKRVQKFEVKPIKSPLDPIEGDFQDGIFHSVYDIREIEDKEIQPSELEYNPEVFEKINKVLRAVRRVVFSLERQKDTLRFFAIAATDIKTDYNLDPLVNELITISYADDFKKASYQLISWVEYMHRAVQEVKYSPQALGDSEGHHLNLYDLSFTDFLVKQIKQRIATKFAVPEVDKGVDIDKEVIKTVRQVLKIYKFKDFKRLELNNVATGNKIFLSQVRLFEEIKE